MTAHDDAHLPAAAALLVIALLSLGLYACIWALVAGFVALL